MLSSGADGLINKVQPYILPLALCSSLDGLEDSHQMEGTFVSLGLPFHFWIVRRD